jgi:hypothetical protein
VDLLRPAAGNTGIPSGVPGRAPAAVAVARTRRSEPSFDVDKGVDEPGQARQWRIHCRDVASRERFLTVLVEHGRVVLVGPPGETAVLTAGQLGQLRAVLQEAADEAER